MNVKIKKLTGLVALAAAGLCALPLTGVAKEGDWILRGSGTFVDPQSDNLTLDGGAGEVQVDDAWGFTFDVTYMFRDHWGVELLGAYPFTHDIDIDTPTGTVALGEVKQLPPVLSLQYHFLPEARFRPYVGVGANYTFFFYEKPSSLEIDDSFGWEGQVGADIGLTDNWLLNLSVRYIDITPDAELGGVDIGEVEVNPWVYSIGVGYRFGRPAPVVAAAPVAAVVAAPPPPPPPAKPLDSDGDGVIDPNDRCPNTPKGDRVGPQGCTCDVTRNVEFAFGSAKLTDKGIAQLEEMAGRLNELQFVAGTVVGHTDSVGPEAYNQKLSERRAQTVADFLESKGIAQDRLQVSGRGESDPIASNDTPEGRAQNRRVTLSRTDCEAPK
jgi:outer membrane protein